MLNLTALAEWKQLDRRLAELEAAICREAESIHEHGWKATKARSRIADHEAEIKRLRKEIGERWG